MSLAPIDSTYPGRPTCAQHIHSSRLYPLGSANLDLTYSLRPTPLGQHGSVHLAQLTRLGPLGFIPPAQPSRLGAALSAQPSHAGSLGSVRKARLLEAIRIRSTMDPLGSTHSPPFVQLSPLASALSSWPSRLGALGPALSSRLTRLGQAGSATRAHSDLVYPARPTLLDPVTSFHLPQVTRLHASSSTH